MLPKHRVTGRARLAAGVFVTWVLQGCALVLPQTMELRDAWPEGVPHHTTLDDVPFFAQDEYQCGPAALATMLNYAGVDVTPGDLAREVYLPSRLGSLQAEMAAAARRHGIVSYQLKPRYEDLLREGTAGKRVLLSRGGSGDGAHRRAANRGARLRGLPRALARQRDCERRPCRKPVRAGKASGCGSGTAPRSRSPSRIGAAAQQSRADALRRGAQRRGARAARSRARDPGRLHRRCKGDTRPRTEQARGSYLTLNAAGGCTGDT